MEPTEISIRRLISSDAERYRKIRLDGLQCNPEAFGSHYNREKAEPLSWFEGRLESSYVLGAFHGEELIGTAALAIGSGKRLHIGSLWGMYVRTTARGQGAGRRLVSAIVDIARDRVEIVQLSVVYGNATARHLYESAGFVQYGLEKKALKQDGEYYDEILMAIDLSQPLYRSL